MDKDSLSGFSGKKLRERTSNQALSENKNGQKPHVTHSASDH